MSVPRERGTGAWGSSGAGSASYDRRHLIKVIHYLVQIACLSCRQSLFLDIKLVYTVVYMYPMAPGPPHARARARRETATESTVA